MRRIFQSIILFSIAFLLIESCKEDDYPVINPDNYKTITLYTDKACYNPGEVVVFKVSKALSGSYEIRYKQLSTLIEKQSVSGSTWMWNAPLNDFTGYMAELYSIENDKETMVTTIAVDVSSDWSHFPRYGFLTGFGNLAQTQMAQVLDNLNRHHINGLQYYDWQYKHHVPLAGTPENPTPVYKNIINSDVYFSTVKNYIDMAHARNMKSMFYNLAFGALSDASYDGVKDDWYIFSDDGHQHKDYHPLPKPPFKSDIFLTNPGNQEWQNYLNAENTKVYAALSFDGFHIDQLGDRGTRYDYSGNQVDLTAGYHSFIESCFAAQPSKYHVMNAVNQYGQEQMANTDVNFLYTEVWSPNNSFADLVNIIQQNDALSNNSKKTVLAAYMNYNLANNTGYFNTPSVLFADAVIFAFGGSHLELGEHMLGKEYFPNNNLQMRADLQKAMVCYYDFSVAYQNLLRDGGSFNNPDIMSTDGKVTLHQWPPVSGNVAVVGKEFENRQVIHLINLAGATHFDWRDDNGNQAYPITVYNCSLSFTSTKPIRHIWFASPDYNNGAATGIEFQTNGNSTTFLIPALSYWDMIVAEYE